MACKWCAHWIGKESHTNISTIGKCIRFPKSEETNENYRCGEFVASRDSYGDNSESIGQRYERLLHMWRNDAQDERQKRLAIEKKLKTLRAKLKKPQSE